MPPGYRRSTRPGKPGASEGNTGFVNVFNVPKIAGICPTSVAFVDYDPETGEPVRDANGRVRKVPRGQPGLLLSKITKAQPFDGYTDPEASEKGWCSTLLATATRG